MRRTPLHPQAKLLLSQNAALGIQPVETLTPEQARQRPQRLPEHREPIAHVEERQIDGPYGPIPLRIYRPEGQGALPVLLWFHGGGWVLEGGMARFDPLLRGLANAGGCAVVAVDYRLAPEHKFPCAAEEAFAATAWVAASAAQFGGDPLRIAVGGDSAGGNLAAVVTHMARDRGGLRLSGQVLVYPVTDYAFDTPSYREYAEGYSLTRAGMIWFWQHYLNTPEDGAHPHASPLRAGDWRTLPPALVITAEYDPLRDESEAYARRLEAAGVPVTLRRYDGMMHGFYSQPWFFDGARDAVAETAAFLRRTFAG